MRMVFRLVIVGLVAGAVLIFTAVKEYRLTSSAKATPQTISLGDLIDNGPGDNAHIKLTDYLLCGWSAVYESNEDTPDRYTRFWVTAVPSDGPEADAIVLYELSQGDLQTPDVGSSLIVLRSNEVNSGAAVTSLAMESSVQGLLVTGVEGLGNDERDLLQEAHPGVDFGSVMVLDHNRQPKSAGLVFGMFGGGLLLIVGPVGFWLYRRVSASRA